MEKNLAKNCACGEKITNMRYAIVSSNGLEFQMASTRREKGDWDVCTEQDCTQTQRWPENLHSGQEGARVTSAGDGSHEVPKLDGRLGERSGPVAHI